MPEEVEEEEVEVEELGVSDGSGAGSESDSEEKPTMPSKQHRYLVQQYRGGMEVQKGEIKYRE